MKDLKKLQRVRLQTVAPYQSVAAFYDPLMAHVDYEDWANYLEACFKKFGKKARAILDGGCGTGSLMKALQNRGFVMAGFDLSLDMIKLARLKGLPSVWQGDLRCIAVKNQWDVMVSLYDTIHYLTRSELELFFKEAYHLIRTDGLIIFDIVTEHHVKYYWANYTEQGEEQGIRFLRRSRYDSVEKCQHTEFEIRTTHDDPVSYEHHRQWIYPLSVYIEEAENCGFEVVGIFNACTFEPGEPDSDRIHIVLTRRQS